MRTYENTICTQCHKVTAVAPGYCLLCGSNLADPLPALLPAQPVVENWMKHAA